MKRITGMITIILIIAMLLPSCAGGAPEETTQEADLSADVTVDVTDAPTEEETTSEPEPEVKYLQKPYIDIEFTSDGGFYDAMEHVECSLDNANKGKVVDEAISIDGKEYKIPHLYIKEQGGVGRLTYKEINDKNELHEMLSSGFTLEMMVLNKNTVSASSAEQCLASSTQSGGYNFTLYKGKYTFSVHTGGKYRNPVLDEAHDKINLTHLVGVYDPNTRTASLYVNGKMVSKVAADGMLTLASGDLWTDIILGGDISTDKKTQLLSYNTRIADYKLYPSAMTSEQISTVYELMLEKMTGVKVDYTVEYYESLEEHLGDRLFTSYIKSYADVYEPNSGIVNSPTVIGYADAADISSIASSEERPATIIFKVKSKEGVLYAYDRDSAEIGTLYDAVGYLRSRIIPAFSIEGKNDAGLLCDFINYHNIGDCFVFSSDCEILKTVRSSTRSARPILDLSGEKSIDLKETKLKVSSCLAKGVIIDSSLLTAEEVTVLRAYSLSVLLKTEKGNRNIHDAIFKGAMGILCEDYKNAIYYIESFKERTLCFPTMIVAHRGDMQNCPENTLPSFISAAKSGADVIELDVYLTKDNYLAINHDATTSKWSKKLTCTESTRAELKALKNIETDATAEDEFAFYEEVVDYFSKNYTDIVFTVEIKDKRNEVIDRVYEVTKAAGMLDRIIIICMDHAIVRYAFETYGVAVQMNKSYIYDKNDLKATLAYACEEVTGLNSSYFTVWNDCIYELNEMLRHRGIKYSPWTTKTEAATDSDYALGYPEFTTNTPHRVDSYARYLAAEIGADGSVKVYRVNYNGEKTDVTAEVRLVVIEGNVSLKNGKLSGSGVFAFAYGTNIGDYNYELCSVSYEK